MLAANKLLMHSDTHRATINVYGRGTYFTESFSLDLHQYKRNHLNKVNIIPENKNY